MILLLIIAATFLFFYFQTNRCNLDPKSLVRKKKRFLLRKVGPSQDVVQSTKMKVRFLKKRKRSFC